MHNIIVQCVIMIDRAHELVALAIGQFHRGRPGDGVRAPQTGELGHRVGEQPLRRGVEGDLARRRELGDTGCALSVAVEPAHVEQPVALPAHRTVPVQYVWVDIGMCQ
eukprot:COSAG01_NODE_156_length_23748_cov_439.062371_12_plen_108_part_00